MLSDTEIAFIRDNCLLLSDRQLASRLAALTAKHVSHWMVKEARYRLGILRHAGPKAPVKSRRK